MEVSNTSYRCTINCKKYTHFGIVDGAAYSNAYYGVGSGPIYLTDVSCTSSSTSLLQCNSDPILSSECSHLEDAGVKCEGNTQCMLTYGHIYV